MFVLRLGRPMPREYPSSSLQNAKDKFAVYKFRTTPANEEIDTNFVTGVYPDILHARHREDPEKIPHSISKLSVHKKALALIEAQILTKKMERQSIRSVVRFRGPAYSNEYPTSRLLEFETYIQDIKSRLCNLLASGSSHPRELAFYSTVLNELNAGIAKEQAVAISATLSKKQTTVVLPHFAEVMEEYFGAVRNFFDELEASKTYESRGLFWDKQTVSFIQNIQRFLKSPVEPYTAPM